MKGLYKTIRSFRLVGNDHSPILLSNIMLSNELSNY